MKIFRQTNILYTFFLIISLNVLSNDNISLEDIQELEALKQGQSVIKEEEKFLEIQTSVIREEGDPCMNCIYGYNLFNKIPTTFALSSNIPIPQDYVLGPGDKISIEYFGNNNDKKEGYISRQGTFNLPLLGPINLSGMQFSKAENLIEKRVNRELIGTEVFISLNELRSISVYLVGAAYKPGTYTVNALSSITNILFATGGPNESGSLRNIEIKRDGKLIKVYDFYDLLLKGNTNDDLRLLDGDTIFYPLIETTVRIDGAVRRPGLFEIKDNEITSDIFNFSGVIDKSDYKIEFSRFNSSKNLREVSIVSSEDKEILMKPLVGGDSINILSNSQKNVANVLLKGEFLYPGYYDISGGETLLDVIKKSGGLTKLAYPEAAVFTRESIKTLQKDSYLKSAESLEKSLIDAVSSGIEIDGSAYEAITKFIENLRQFEPTGRQVASLDEYTLRSDPKTNFSLQDGDVIIVPKRSASVSVVGEVLNSSTHLFDQELTVDDYIGLSGGVTNGADLSQIFVILPNGQSSIYQKKLFQNDLNSKIIPGSTIVVSRNPDPFDWLKLTTLITPILSDLAVSAAAIAAIDNN